MKSFAVKEMWKFSLLQLNEMFCYGKKKAFIQLLFLRSFSICVICALVSGDSLKECLSLIEQLLILLSYYFTFWSLVENMRNDRGLINKFMLPVTLAEKYVSLFFSTFLIGTVMLLGCAILSNIFMQLAIPLLFTEETNGPVLLFWGGGYGLKQLMLQVVIAFYVALWTLVVMLRKQYSKTRFWLIVVLCVLSYVLPVLCMYGLGAPKSIIKYTWSIVSVVWSIVAVIMTYKGFRKLEFR